MKALYLCLFIAVTAYTDAVATDKKPAPPEKLSSLICLEKATEDRQIECFKALKKQRALELALSKRKLANQDSEIEKLDRKIENLKKEIAENLEARSKP